MALNSIAFGSAPRREAGTQPIRQLDRPAVSPTETHTLGFLSVADTAANSAENGRPQEWQWANGNAGGRRLFGRRFEPRCDQHDSGVAAGVCRTRFEPPTQNYATGCVTIRPWVDITQICLPLLAPFSAKTFDPPPQKSVIQFYRIERPQNQKIHQGIVLLGKIMILQGVGHQISCLGVCYANDPKKGGYTTPAPALDLTTSLRGDLHKSRNPHGFVVT